MTENILLTLTIIIVLGVCAQWISWKIHLPSILLLLIFGFISGPILGIIKPDLLMGKLLLPVVSISVAIILFEGGLSLKLSELQAVGKMLRNLITIGVLVSCIIIGFSAHKILGLSIPLSALIGAILVVTGPTAMGPLLRHMQLVGRIQSIVKWEGIMIAPVGAILAVLCFEAIGTERQIASSIIITLLLKTLTGIIVGLIGATILVILLKKHLIPYFLQNVFSLMLVICIFTVSNLIQPKSGLLAVTIMGIILANQKFVQVSHIVKFKEDLRLFLIAGIFILLSARLQLESLSCINLNSFLFLLVLIFIARPLSVLISSIGSNLNWKEILFLSFLAPRGIVAAAVSSIFALSLTAVGFPNAEILVPLTFFIIVSTVLFYGLFSHPLAIYLKLSQPSPQGVLILGADLLARNIAMSIHKEGYRVVLIDTNQLNIYKARLHGLNALKANILSESLLDELDLGGVGRLLALTYNDEINSLATLRFKDIFGPAEIYQLSTEKKNEDPKKGISQHLSGRTLFSSDITYNYLFNRFTSNAVLKKTLLTKEFNYKSFNEHYRETAIPLFLITETNKLQIFTTDGKITPKPGQSIISLVNAIENK